MEFTIKKLNTSVHNLMRDLGYHFQREENKEMAFYKPLSNRDYPRFHIYLKYDNEMYFNIHLDQKKPIYEGAPAHNAEYDGELVTRETERIKKFFDNLV
ncbi:MAG: hypothetical protein Q7T34_01750 [Candidatus Parcubacteria bacterium]|nr:hypothetical protein [Candidatus Parcubacteria bacterium]